MNFKSRVLSGLVFIIFAIWFVIQQGFLEGSSVDYYAIVFGIAFFILGVFILFNKKEDDIEEIKKSK